MTLAGRNLHFLYLPLDGVAAYWLSLRKLVGNSRHCKALEEEARFVGEPFVRHLLDMLIAQVPAAATRRYGQIRADSELDRLGRQLDLIRITVTDVASGENPLRTLARMSARMQALENPESLLESAQAMVGKALQGTLDPADCRVDHHSPDLALAASLLFFSTLCRRHGKAAARPFLPQTDSKYFTDALSLVIDGFDLPFVRKWLKRSKATLAHDLDRKMALSIDMAVAIQERVPFEEMRFLVHSHIR